MAGGPMIQRKSTPSRYTETLSVSDSESSFVSCTVKGSTRTLACDIAIRDDGPPVDEHPFDAQRVMVWVVESCNIVNRCRIENCDIRHHTGPENAAIGEAHADGRSGRHLANR